VRKGSQSYGQPQQPPESAGLAERNLWATASDRSRRAARVYVKAPTRLNVSSSQSNMRCADSCGEPTWQWSSAPSAAVKFRKVLSQVSASNSCRACPGYHRSPSESTTRVGQVIFSATPASV